MEEEIKSLRQEVQEALHIFKTGVQFAVTISGLAVGASLGAVIVSGSSLAGTLWGVGLVLLIGAIAGATASYSMFRAESRQAQPLENEYGEHRGDHGDDKADYRSSNF